MKTEFLKSSGDFVKGFIPPDYAIEGLFQKTFLYCLVAPTGFGKTAVMLLITMLKALGKPMGRHAMDKGRVVYLAGENFCDVQMRWIKMCHDWKVDTASLDVQFMEGANDLRPEQTQQMIADQCDGPVDLLLTDTSTAFFQGDNENDNAQAYDHAIMCRQLVNTLPGKPMGLIACHPRGAFDKHNLVPRGGTSFFNELDGGTYLWRERGASHVELCRHPDKFRGPMFESVPFSFNFGSAPALVDSKGRTIGTVTAVPMSEAEYTASNAKFDNDRYKILELLTENPGSSFRVMAEQMGTNNSKIQRLVGGLEQEKWVEKAGGSFHVTKAGANALKKRPEPGEAPF